MPTPYPTEFRSDVIAVAREGNQTMAQVARSFGISEACLARWLRVADREDGLAGRPAPPAKGGDLETENRELCERTEQLEQENEILRRATAYFTRLSPVNFVPTPTCVSSAATSYADRWAGSGPARTTPRWSRSSACRRRTS